MSCSTSAGHTGEVDAAVAVRAQEDTKEEIKGGNTKKEKKLIDMIILFLVKSNDNITHPC